jgi:hypothetical protein
VGMSFLEEAQLDDENIDRYLVLPIQGNTSK